MNKNMLGKQGEDAAAEFLRCRGYQILTRNFRMRTGELDIVAKHEDVIVFIEVKTRKSHRFGTPGQAVTRRKQQKIIHTARWFLRQYQLEQMCCRFDVMEVAPRFDRTWDIRQICGAFEEM